MRNRIPVPRRADLAVRARPARDAWWRQPVLWIGLAILLATLAGCIVMLALGARYADTPLAGAGAEVLRMPLARPPSPQVPR